MSKYHFMPTHRAVPTSYVLTTYERRLIAQHYAKVARQARRATHDALHPSPDTEARKSGFVLAARVTIAVALTYVLIVSAMVLA